jgi:hypothetical protein
MSKVITNASVEDGRDPLLGWIDNRGDISNAKLRYNNDYPEGFGIRDHGVELSRVLGMGVPIKEQGISVRRMRVSLYFHSGHVDKHWSNREYLTRK